MESELDTPTIPAPRALDADLELRDAFESKGMRIRIPQAQRIRVRAPVGNSLEFIVPPKPCKRHTTELCGRMRVDSICDSIQGGRG
jgi:hypothetical protein